MKLLFTLLSVLLLVAGTVAQEDGQSQEQLRKKKQSPRAARGQSQRDLQFYQSGRPNLGNGRLFARNGMTGKEGSKSGSKEGSKGGSWAADAEAIHTKLDTADELMLCIGTGKGYCGEVRVVFDPETCDDEDEIEKVVDVGEGCDDDDGDDDGDDDVDDDGDDDVDDDVDDDGDDDVDGDGDDDVDDDGDDDVDDDGDDDVDDDGEDDDDEVCPAGQCRAQGSCIATPDGQCANTGGNWVVDGPACAPAEEEDAIECPVGECRDRDGNCVDAPFCSEGAVAEVEAAASASVSVPSCGVNEIYENGECICIPGAHKMGGATCQCVAPGTIPNALGNQCVRAPPPTAFDQMP